MLQVLVGLGLGYDRKETDADVEVEHEPQDGVVRCENRDVDADSTADIDDRSVLIRASRECGDILTRPLGTTSAGDATRTPSSSLGCESFDDENNVLFSFRSADVFDFSLARLLSGGVTGDCGVEAYGYTHSRDICMVLSEEKRQFVVLICSSE